KAPDADSQSNARATPRKQRNLIAILLPLLLEGFCQTSRHSGGVTVIISIQATAPGLELTATLHPRSSATGLRVLERLQHFVEAEAADLLARREFLERSQELPDVLLRRHEQEGSVDSPVSVVHADDVSLLERVRAQVEDLGKAQHDEWLLPD